MHTSKTLQPTVWLTYLKKALSGASGTFEAKDNSGIPILVEWYQTDIQSPVLVAFKKNICELASQILAPIEVQFLRAFPQAVSQELFLKPCTPFFERGVEDVNWSEVEEKIKSTIKQFYLTDLSKFGAHVIKPLLDDIYIFATAKEKISGKLLGFFMSSITPALPYGSVKVINLGISENERNRGLDRLLLSSLFKIIPEINHLFLFTRPTNENDLKAYRSLGFTQEMNSVKDPNHTVNMEYLTLMEYSTKNSNILQSAYKNLF